MSDVTNPLFGYDISEMLRKQKLAQDLSTMPVGTTPEYWGINQPPQFPTPQPQGQQFPTPQPTTQPQTTPLVISGKPSPDASGTTIAPWETPPVAAPPPNPYQSQIDAINKNVTEMSKAGADLSSLKGQPLDPRDPSLYKVSKLRAALLMPLQALAGAAGKDTSQEYASLIRPGYTAAASDYQRRIDAAKSKFDTLKETTKAQLDALKDEGTITKDQAEMLDKQAATRIRGEELKVRQQEAKTAEESIPPLQQTLQMARDDAAKRGVPFETKDALKVIGEYDTVTNAAKVASEKAKWLAEQHEREEQAKVNRQRITIGQQISSDQKYLEKGIEPIIRAKQNISALIASIDSKDANGAERLLSTIQGDLQLTPGIGRGTVRQNIGLINGLIKAPGFWDQVKGWWQGLTQPGKGSIPDETLKGIRNYAVRMLDSVNQEGDYYQDHLNRLGEIDPADDPIGARQLRNGVMNDFYKGAAGTSAPAEPTTTSPPPPKTPGPVTDPGKEKDIKKRLDKINEAIRKKTQE